MEDSRVTILHSTADQSVTGFLEAFQALQKVTPRDRNGFLTYFLDHNQLPEDFHTRPPQKQQQFIDVARVSLQNTEGYPTFDFHQPIWNQLPHEPDAYYSAFRIYLLTPNRSLEEAQNRIGATTAALTLEEIYHFFYWQERARAYDILRPVAAARLREQRLMLMEDTQYVMSNQLLAQLGEEVEARSEEQNGRPWQGLQSADLFKSIIAAAELQRTAVGLPAKGPKLRDETYQPAPLAGIDRTVREGVTNHFGVDGDNATPAQQLKKAMEAAMAQDPALAASLQEQALLVIQTAKNQKSEAAKREEALARAREQASENAVVYGEDND